eukprot:353811-Hanusia_phi.AAC.2
MVKKFDPVENFDGLLGSLPCGCCISGVGVVQFAAGQTGVGGGNTGRESGKGTRIAKETEKDHLNRERQRQESAIKDQLSLQPKLTHTNLGFGSRSIVATDLWPCSN